MGFQQLLDTITPAVYENLKRAVELGKWSDGRMLTPQQRQLSLQAIIAYEVKHYPPEQRSGYVPPKLQAHSNGKGESAKLEGAGLESTEPEGAEPEAPEPLSWQSTSR